MQKNTGTVGKKFKFSLEWNKWSMQWDSQANEKGIWLEHEYAAEIHVDIFAFQAKGS